MAFTQELEETDPEGESNARSSKLFIQGGPQSSFPWQSGGVSLGDTYQMSRIVPYLLHQFLTDQDGFHIVRHGYCETMILCVVAILLADENWL